MTKDVSCIGSELFGQVYKSRLDLTNAVRSIRQKTTQSGHFPQTHPVAKLDLVSELQYVTSDPFEALSDVLRIFTAEVLEGKRIGCIEVAAELDPIFRSQRAIDLEDFA